MKVGVFTLRQRRGSLWRLLGYEQWIKSLTGIQLTGYRVSRWCVFSRRVCPYHHYLFLLVSERMFKINLYFLSHSSCFFSCF